MEQPNSPEPTIKESFHKLLLALLAFDADDTDERPEVKLEQINILEQGKAKVDGYKWILDNLEVHKLYMKGRKEAYAKAEKSIEKHIDSILDNMLFALQTNKFEKFTGNEFVVKVYPSTPSVEIKGGDPTASHKIHYDKYVKVKYEWDKTAISSALKVGEDASLAEFASLKRGVHLRFAINKEAKK